MMISSLSNPKIKRVVKLKHRKYRDQLGLTCIDGLREVKRAFESDIFFEECFLCREILERFAGQKACDELSSWGLPWIEVSSQVFEKISFGDRKEGVLAIFRPKPCVLSWEGMPRDPLILVMESVEKPGNLGAVLRTCDGAGVDAVIVAGTKTDIFNPNVIRASTGTVFSMRIMQATTKQVIDFLKEKDARIVVATPSGKQSYWTTDLCGSMALVLGTEDEGLSQEWFNSCDEQLMIPMLGKADSLNVSNTAAILVYESLRQRRKR